MIIFVIKKNINQKQYKERTDIMLRGVWHSPLPILAQLVEHLTVDVCIFTCLIDIKWSLVRFRQIGILRVVVSYRIIILYDNVCVCVYMCYM